MIRRPPGSPLFPYPPLFRSGRPAWVGPFFSPAKTTICARMAAFTDPDPAICARTAAFTDPDPDRRSEEHTSELQSHLNLVCRLLLQKKKTTIETRPTHTPLP